MLTLKRHTLLLTALFIRSFRPNRVALAQHKRHTHVEDDTLVIARQWQKTFSRDSIPSQICHVSFSRSSGAGGQHVNKTSSKATLRVAMSDLLPLIPPLLHGSLRKAHQYAKNSDSLVISADESRKQSDNVEACFRRLYQLISSTAEKLVPGETSEAQRQRVLGLQKADNERRIRLKKSQSQKKASRKYRGDD